MCLTVADEDIDGTPMDINEEDNKSQGGKTGGSGFVLSRWETVDPELVEAQAMTTSKWDTLEHQNNSQDDSQEEEDNSNLDFRYVLCKVSSYVFRVCYGEEVGVWANVT